MIDVNLDFLSQDACARTPIGRHIPMPAPAARHRDSVPDALSVLNSVFGLPAFRGAQEEIVRHVTDGGNCLVLMPTGGGKSLCYQLPSCCAKAAASWCRR
jgi:superfamily II DNA helicase RecQ